MVIACSRTFVAWLKTTIQTVRSTEGSLHRQPLMKIASQGAILSWTGSPSWHTPDELWRYVTCRHIWMVQWWFGRGPPKYQLRKWRVREMYFFSIHPDTVHLHCDWKGLGDSRFWLLYSFLWRALCLHLCISGRYIAWRWVFPETMRWRRSRRGWAVGWARAQPIRFWIGIFLMRPKGPKEGLRKGHNRGHVILVSECSL